MTTIQLKLESEAATQAMAGSVARMLPDQCVLYLSGDLGAGKTTFARAMLRQLGYSGTVRSPTYTLIEPYDLPDRTAYHLDLYRLGDPEELEYLGLRDMLEGRYVCLVEWPQRGQGMLPRPDLELTLAHLTSGREMTLRAASAAGEAMLAAIRENNR